MEYRYRLDELNEHQKQILRDNGVDIKKQLMQRIKNEFDQYFKKGGVLEGKEYKLLEFALKNTTVISIDNGREITSSTPMGETFKNYFLSQTTTDTEFDFLQQGPFKLSAGSNGYKVLVRPSSSYEFSGTFFKTYARVGENIAIFYDDGQPVCIENIKTGRLFNAISQCMGNNFTFDFLTTNNECYIITVSKQETPTLALFDEDGDVVEPHCTCSKAQAEDVNYRYTYALNTLIKHYPHIITNLEQDYLSAPSSINEVVGLVAEVLLKQDPASFTKLNTEYFKKENKKILKRLLDAAKTSLKQRVAGAPSQEDIDYAQDIMAQITNKCLDEKDNIKEAQREAKEKAREAQCEAKEKARESQRNAQKVKEASKSIDKGFKNISKAKRNKPTDDLEDATENS